MEQRVLREELIVAQPVKKFRLFYGTRRSIALRVHKSPTQDPILIQMNPGEISGFYGSEYEDDCLLGCCAMYSGRIVSTFQRYLLPP
jgi:hypothetical protein